MPPQIQAHSADNDNNNNLLNGGKETLDSSAQATNHFRVKWFSDWEGYGCVASRDIERYTVIHIEEPFIKGAQISNALSLHNNGQLTSQSDDTAYLKHTCGKSDEEIERFWQLHDQYQHKYKDPSTKRLWGIIAANSFENHEKNFHKRLYLTTSRFNHSCSPNVAYEFVGWTIRLYSMRDIKAGETLCISYSDVMYHFPSGTRKDYLIGAYNFDCACTACDSSMDQCARMKSDNNRGRLKKIAIELKHRVNATLYSSGKCINPSYIADDRVYHSSSSNSPLLLSSPMKEFCIQVKEIANRVSCARGESQGGKEVTENDESRLQRRAELIERARLRKLSAGIPIGQCDVDLISEYISLLEQEMINFDMLPIYKLAYHVSLKAGATRNPPQEWAEKYLELARCAKGFDENSALVSLQLYQPDDESRPPWLSN